ncbi:hypothetical protein AAIB41_03175 [Brucella sp. BE17]|uniref:hypothetical protein n=1 Tax=Brucella sp. BE17 TaxID=3142977 RepID=UPI0031BA38CF
MKEWLSGIIGEGGANIVGFVFIFAIILVFIVVVIRLIRRLSGRTFVSGGRTRQPRLSVMDAAAVDGRRKLVLIRRDDVEHLLLIGGPTDVVVEQNIVKETRARARVDTRRIEPEHIERFRQHEAGIAGDSKQRPALAQANPAEQDQAIEVNSAIETPIDRSPKPIEDEPTVVAATQPAMPQSPVQAPVQAPARVPVHAPEQPSVVAPKQQPPVHQARPSPAPVRPTEQAKDQTPRSVTNYPPQPRTVLPSPPPQTSAQSSARLHPAYPLGQVSRGVLSSTSAAAAATAASSAASTSASSALGNVVPERDDFAAAKPSTETTAAPQVSVPVTPELDVSASSTRIEPEMPTTSPRTQAVSDLPEFNISTNSQHAEPEMLRPSLHTKAASVSDDTDDELNDLDDALHEAIAADLAGDIIVDNPEASSSEPEFTLDSFEHELLSSLDISAADETPSDDIESEMEKLLGELSPKETR